MLPSDLYAMVRTTCVYMAIVPCSWVYMAMHLRAWARTFCMGDHGRATQWMDMLIHYGRSMGPYGGHLMQWPCKCKFRGRVQTVRERGQAPLLQGSTQSHAAGHTVLTTRTQIYTNAECRTV